MSPGTVTVQTTARVIDGDGVVANCAVELKFDAARPLEVQAVFPPRSDGPNEWTFSRDLLVRGLTEPAGSFRVIVEPARDTVAIHLSNCDGEAATVHLPKWSVATFVESMLALVPPGEEHLDFDQELTDLLDGAR